MSAIEKIMLGGVLGTFAFVVVLGLVAALQEWRTARK